MNSNWCTGTGLELTIGYWVGYINNPKLTILLSRVNIVWNWRLSGSSVDAHTWAWDWGGGRGALVPLSDLVIRVHPSQTRREAACQAQCMPLYVAQRYNEAALTAAQSTRHINDAVSVQMASCYGRLAGDPEMRVKFWQIGDQCHTRRSSQRGVACNSKSEAVRQIHYELQTDLTCSIRQLSHATIGCETYAPPTWHFLSRTFPGHEYLNVKKT